MISNIVENKDVESMLLGIIDDFHINGPINPSHLEKLSYIKIFQNDLLSKYESKILYLLGLFYKVKEPSSFLEEIYSIYRDSIIQETKKVFTPVQAHAFKQINENKYFSFSAPTSAGKSYLFRELITHTSDDIVIVVPSRALIAEYINIVYKLVDNDVLVLSFIENINTSNINRRIFIITPERSIELFKRLDDFNISLFLLDEAQISEEGIRGLKFDSLVRRISKLLPEAKKVFAHPFVENPEAQFLKHNITTNISSIKYNQLTVGKIFISVNKDNFNFFSPYEKFSKKIMHDPIIDILKNNGTLLIYVSKNKIYDNNHLIDFAKYIDICANITNENALKLINTLETFIGSSSTNPAKLSTLIQMMKKGIVIHHGSIPLKARLLIEEFVNLKYARICFATATLIQGINMPFDVVFIDNFHRLLPLNLKNLIGRAGRTHADNSAFEFGYVVVKEENVPSFSKRIQDTVSISEKSLIDEKSTLLDIDSKDIVEAIKNDTFDDNLYLTKTQVERLKDESVYKNIKYVLSHFIKDGEPITGKDYYNLSDPVRKMVKKFFGNIYKQHLRKDSLTKAEAAVLSASIPIILWHIQGKSFSEMVSLRHAYLSEKDKQREIKKLIITKEISAEEGKKLLKNTPIRFSPKASSLPNSTMKLSSLFDKGTSVLDINYDKLVYDTYDYLDKVISLSIIDPLCAAFEIYYEYSNDNNALIMKNYLRYGTNDNKEIWMLKYGLTFEEIEKFSDLITSINQTGIYFSKEIEEINLDLYPIIKRYVTIQK